MRNFAPLLVSIVALTSAGSGAMADVADDIRRLREADKPQRAYELASGARGSAVTRKERESAFLAGWIALRDLGRPADAVPHFRARSEERRGGKEGVRTGRSRGWPY